MMTPCKRCKGTGQLPGAPRVTAPFFCPRCKGSGVFDYTKAVEATPEVITHGNPGGGEGWVPALYLQMQGRALRSTVGTPTVVFELPRAMGKTAMLIKYRIKPRGDGRYKVLTPKGVTLGSVGQKIRRGHGYVFNSIGEAMDMLAGYFRSMGAN